GRPQRRLVLRLVGGAGPGRPAALVGTSDRAPRRPLAREHGLLHAQRLARVPALRRPGARSLAARRPGVSAARKAREPAPHEPFEALQRELASGKPLARAYLVRGE